jgi:hypothetical protein
MREMQIGQVLKKYIPNLGPSARIAVFTFGLSSWVEAYSQLRVSSTTSSLLDPYLPFTWSTDFEDELDSEENGNSSIIQRWLNRKGRRFDDLERAVLCALDVLVRLPG